jgi:uncharacterized protein (TIGR03435 family)
MRIRIAAVMVLCAATSAASAQQASGMASAGTAAVAPAAGAGAAKAFEVASVRKSPPPDMQTMMMGLSQGRRPDSLRVDGARATYTYMSLKQLIAYAYKLRVYEVTGPDWLKTDRFEIAAKLPDGASKDDVPDMMRALLEERFKLGAHKETKDVPVLGLMVAKGGPKLTESTEPVEEIDPNAPLKPGQSRMDTVDGPVLLTRTTDGATMYHMGPRGTFKLKFDGQTRSMRMTCKGMSMRGLAVMMTSLGGGEGRQVDDQTGLKGRYDVVVDFSLMDLLQSLHDQGIDIPHGPMGGSGDGMASDPGGGETMSQALASLGLKVEKSHAVLERLVVDHVEQDPTEQ